MNGQIQSFGSTLTVISSGEIHPYSSTNEKMSRLGSSEICNLSCLIWSPSNICDDGTHGMWLAQLVEPKK